MCKNSRIRQVLILTFTMLISWMLPLFGFGGIALPVVAASVDYPVQMMNIATKDSSKVLTENGTTDGSTLSVKALGSNLSPSWRFDRVGSDSNGTFFKICNVESGRLLTPQSYNVSAGANIIVYGSESKQSQHWYVIPVQNDHLGNNLYYKIVNYSDTSLALTQSSSGMTLASYTGDDNQLWLLNSDGLQGFAGYCSNDNTGNIKAADIGGLFGETVEVSTFADLKKYATSDTPYTIVVTKNISVTNLTTDSSGHYYCPEGRIYVHSNKTIIGSYSAHTLNNVQFCTSSNNGTGNNIIIKNFEMQHAEKSNGNDSIVVYFGSGQNLWVDHVTFTGHSAVNTQGDSLPDWDKFLACCYDADYCTVSDSSFGLHEYGLILGYPADDANSYNNYNNFPRMSLIGNKFNETVTRGPGLMRYGYFHSLNNYVNKFSMAYTVHSACKIFAENCSYENGGNVICDWNTVTYPGSYAESGSTFSGCGRTKIEGYATSCTWRPTTNYSYVSLTAANAKTYCTSYSDSQTSKGNWMYLRYATKGIPSAGYTESPSAPPRSAFKTIEAEDYDIESGTKNEDGTGETHVAYIENGDYICFNNVDFEDGARSFIAKVTGNASQIELHLDKISGTPAATINFDGSGGWSSWTELNANIPVISGTHTLYLVFKGGDGYLVNIDNFVFSKNINGRLIKNVSFTTANSSTCTLADNAAIGSPMFGDREFTFSALPDKLLGAEQILTACNDKGETGDIISFVAAEDITIYIVLDNRMEALPSFMSKYTKTEFTAVSSNDVTFELYKLEVNKGDNVTLGGNGQNYNVVNYSVLIMQTDKTVPGDVNDDGEFSIADVVLLQKWLLAVPGTTLPNWKAADLCEDNMLDVFDLCMMKQLLINKK